MLQLIMGTYRAMGQWRCQYTFPIACIKLTRPNFVTIEQAVTGLGALYGMGADLATALAAVSNTSL